MGARRLLKDGVITKAKSKRKLHAFLCSDILVLTDEGVKVLYRMVILIYLCMSFHTDVVHEAYPVIWDGGTGNPWQSRSVCIVSV
jgi:hypothetical protein